MAIARAMAFKRKYSVREATTGLDLITATTVDDEVISCGIRASARFCDAPVADAFYVARNMAVRKPDGASRSSRQHREGR